MARAVTAPELAKLRGSQFSRLFAVVDQPAQIWAGRVSSTPASLDAVTQIAYSSGSGTLGNILPGMTLYASGSAAGLYDKGTARVRAAADGSNLYLGRESEIDFSSGDFVTVMDEYKLWLKPWLVDVDGVAYADGVTAFSDQWSAPTPVVVMGPDAFMWCASGSSVNYQPSCGDSWVPLGALASYAWSAPGASATSGMNTATPTITYNAAGRYKLACTVTTAAGKTSTGRRNVYVADPANPTGLAGLLNVFALKSFDGSASDGGYEFELEAYSGASVVAPNAKCLLVSLDYYSATAGSLGPVSGVEAVLGHGWVDEASITHQPEYGTVAFRVRGAHYWLDQMHDYALAMTNTTAAAEDWQHYQGLTVDDYLYILLHYNTTATTVIDVTLSGNTNTAAELAEDGSIFGMMSAAAEKICAAPIVDRLGRLFVQTDIQYLPVASRGLVPVVMGITKSDRYGSLEIDYRPVPTVSQIDLSGFTASGSTATPVYSLAPGRVYKHFGSPDSADNLIVSGQSEANSLAGLILAQRNNTYPKIGVRLAENNRFFDIAPLQVGTLSIQASDTPLGIAFSGKQIIPRGVTFDYDPASGALLCSVEFEGVTTPELSVTSYRPPANDPNTYQPPVVPASYPGSLPPPTIPGGYPYQPPTYTPPPPPPMPGCPDSMDAPENGPWGTGMAGSFYDADLNGLTGIYGRCPCWLRSPAAEHTTRFELDALLFGRSMTNPIGDWTGDTVTSLFDWCVLEALNERTLQVLATGVLDSRSEHRYLGHWDNPVAVYCKLFRLRFLNYADRGLNPTSWTLYDDHGLWPAPDELVPGLTVSIAGGTIQMDWNTTLRRGSIGLNKWQEQNLGAQFTWPDDPSYHWMDNKWFSYSISLQISGAPAGSKCQELACVLKSSPGALMPGGEICDYTLADLDSFWTYYQAGSVFTNIGADYTHNRAALYGKWYQPTGSEISGILYGRLLLGLLPSKRVDIYGLNLFNICGDTEP